MQNYQILGRKGEGTFSEVLKAEDKITGQLVAIKCMKKRFKSMDQVNKLREVLSIRRLQAHHNIVKLISVLFDHSSGRLALVFELMDLNLYEVIKDRKQYLPEEKVCHIAYQMLRGLEYVHSHGLLHRDIKPENLLFNASDGTLKIADFGSSRGIYSNQPFTEYISTRWYRAPECLLTDGYYSFKMDLWSAGCVLFEIMSLFPLFPGNNELDQIHKIHNVLGTPSKELLDRLKAKGSHVTFDFPQKKGTGLAKLVPSASPDALDLLSRLLEYDEDARITAKEALRHPYFKKMREAERRQRAAHRRHRAGSTPKDPTASDTAAAATVGGRGGSDDADAANGSMTSVPSLSIPVLERAAGRRPSVNGDTSDAGGAASAKGDDERLPRIDATPPLHYTHVSANLSVASSSCGRRQDGDGSGAHSDATSRATTFTRGRKTRRMSLPKL